MNRRVLAKLLKLGAWSMEDELVKEGWSMFMIKFMSHARFPLGAWFFALLWYFCINTI